MNKPGRRISSLEAAGVKLTPKTISSSSSTSTTTKKRPTPPPITTKKASRTPFTTTFSPAVSSPKLTKTHGQTKDSSNNTSPVTPLLKKRSTTVGRPDSPSSTARSASRASNRIISTISSRASILNSNSETLSKRRPAENTYQQTATSDPSVIEELKDKNATIQKALLQKEQALAERDINLNDLKEQLKQLQHEINIRSSYMHSQQGSSETTIAGSEMEHLLDDYSFQEQNTTKKEEEMLEQIKFLQQQSDEMQQLINKERLNHSKQYEDAEKRNRDNIEKLRERYENEKLVFTTNILEKDREIEKLRKDMDQMRNDIRDMHQTHQTRLTTLTNQLNHQHTQDMNELRSEYEARSNDKYEDYEENFQYRQELESKFTEIKLLQTRIDTQQALSLKEQEEFKTAISLLKNAHKEEIRVLELACTETEANLNAELDQYKFKLQMSNEKIQLVEEDLRKERSVQYDVTLLQEKHALNIEKLREAFNTEKTDIKSRLEKDYSTQLRAEIEKLTVAKNEELQDLKIKTENSLQAHIMEIRVAHEQKLLEIELERSALTNKVNNLEETKLKNENASYESMEIHKEERLNLEEQFENDRAKYEELVTKYEALNGTLSDVESMMVEKTAEFEASISNLEMKHSLIMKNIREDHRLVVEGLKIDYEKALKLVAAEHESISTEMIPRAETEVYEKKIKSMEENEQLLIDKLAKTIEKLNNQSEEQLALLTKAKIDADSLCYQMEQECIENLKTKDVEYSSSISKLKDDISKLTDSVKGSDAKYIQSMEELKMVLISEALSLNNDLQLEDEVENFKKTKDLDIQSAKRFLVKLLVTKNRFDNESTQARLQTIIEQHQKELSILQNQFQYMLDMKDKELNDLFYKIKSRRDSISTNETCSTNDKVIEQELRKQIHVLEDDVKSKSLEMRWLESDNEQNEIKIKDQGNLIRKLQLNIDKLKSSYEQLKDENEHMLRLIHHLQGEIHQL